MVNFGAPDTVPEQFARADCYVHNAQVTLMRTTPEESVEIGRFLAAQDRRVRRPVRFLLPTGGVSALDAPGSRSTIRRPTGAVRDAERRCATDRRPDRAGSRTTSTTRRSRSAGGRVAGGPDG